MNQSITFYYIGAGLLLILIVIVIISMFRMSKQRRKKKSESSDYIRALNALIERNYPEAIKNFYSTVQQNTENVDAYLKLGDIFRHQGKIEKAIKVHKELLVRQDIDYTTRVEIIRSLVTDFIIAKYYDRALESLNKLFAIEPKNIWAKRQQLAIYEQKNEWDKAFDTLKTLAKWENQKDISDQLAFYKVEQAKQSFHHKKEKEGRIELREAIKIDPNCAPAYIELGDSYVRENRYTDAIKEWVRFVRHLPDQSYLVFDRLQEELYSIGNYSEVENILQGLHDEHPNIMEVSFALADIQVRKGDIKGAIDLCEGVYEKNPDATEVISKLIKLYKQDGQQNKALELAEKLADQYAMKEKNYRCSVCYYETNKPLWHCPNCGAWKSFDI